MAEEKKAVEHKINTVVLIDDNEVDNLINQKLMESSKFAKFIYTYTSGKSALEFFKNIDRNPGFPDDLVPELILLDINMPLMNGFLFLEQFRKLSHKLTDKTKVIFLTSSVNPQDVQKANENDLVVDYISKPLNKEKLKDITLK